MKWFRFSGVDTAMAAGRPRSKFKIAREKRRLEEWQRKHNAAKIITVFMKTSSVQKVSLL
jgi:hypothetical protein